MRCPTIRIEPANDEEKVDPAALRQSEGQCRESGLREGNSDRRAPNAVKQYARKNPHSMGAWSAQFEVPRCSHEWRRLPIERTVSMTIAKEGKVRIELVSTDGKVTVLKEKIPVLAGEVIDATVMSVRALNAFLEKQDDDARKQGVLFSLHLKATMMKVSDPIIFGHAVKVFFKDVFEKHGALLARSGVNANNGFGNLLEAIQKLPDAKRAEIEADIQAGYKSLPDLAMVNSSKGITNLHVPSDIIIDASMPAMIRASGQMWNKENKLQDTRP